MEEREMAGEKQVRSSRTQKEVDEEFLRLADRGIEDDKVLLKKLAKA